MARSAFTSSSILDCSVLSPAGSCGAGFSGAVLPEQVPGVLVPVEQAPPAQAALVQALQERVLRELAPAGRLLPCGSCGQVPEGWLLWSRFAIPFKDPSRHPSLIFTVYQLPS